MRALRLEDGKAVLDEQMPGPAPGKADALIRPVRMGVCATDLALCKGYMDFSGVLGHEFVGVVESVGEGADASWVGQRVVGEINCVCGVCDMCKAGLREHCRDRTVLGIAGRDGCFADRFVLPVTNLHRVPDHVDDDHAVFVEPLAAAYQVLRQITVEGRPNITVLGDGRLGLLCAQVLGQLNATVRCIGKHESKLSLCEKWGVKHRLLSDIGLRQDQDIVVDCTGSSRGFGVALQLVRPRGTVVLKTTVAPGDMQPDGLDLSPIVINEVHVIGSRCGPFAMALDALSAEKVDVVSLITKRMRLADGPAILEQAAKRGSIKVLVEP